MVRQKPFHNSRENKIQHSLEHAWAAAAGNAAVGGDNASTDDGDNNDENSDTNTADEESPPFDETEDDRKLPAVDSDDDDDFDPSYFEDNTDQYNDGNESNVAVDMTASRFQVPHDVAQQARSGFISFQFNLSGIIGHGLDWNIPGFNKVLVPINTIRQWVRDSYNALPLWIQNNIGNRNPGHPVIVYVTQDILDFFQVGNPDFDKSDIPTLSIDQLLAAEAEGLLPILKALSKMQIKYIVGGDWTTLKSLTSTNPMLYRSGVFTVIGHDEEKWAWDKIKIHSNSDAKLASAKASKCFSVFDFNAPDSLLAKVNGITNLFNLIGKFEKQFHPMIRTNDDLQTAIEQNGGQLIVSSDKDDKFGFIVKFTPIDCHETPVAGAETRITQIQEGIRSRRVGHTGTGLGRGGCVPSDFYWIVFRDSELADVHAHGKGINALRRKLTGLVPGTRESQYKGGWSKVSSGITINDNIGGTLSKAFWKKHCNPNGTMYTSRGAKWVMAFDNKTEQTNALNRARTGVEE